MLLLNVITTNVMTFFYAQGYIDEIIVYTTCVLHTSRENPPSFDWVKFNNFLQFF